MKNCSKCNKIKENLDFNKNVSNFDKLSDWCKLCNRENNKLYKLKNSVKVKEKRKIYEDKNKDRIRVRKLNYRRLHKDEKNKKQREYRLKNKEEHNRKKQEYREKIRIKNNKPKHIIHPNAKLNNKIAANLRIRMRLALKNHNKSGSAVRDLGCSIPELIAYIENKFQPGMTWENRGLNGWHIDHIIPLCSFNLSNREDFLKACHYTNLQPLWVKDHRKKTAKDIFFKFKSDKT